MEYHSTLVPESELAQALKTFFSQGGKGCNITAPFKEQAYTLCTLHTERALKAQAVNTIKAIPQGLLGDNTDGAGILRDLQHHLDLNDQHILIIGAGGATQGILFSLIQAKPVSITIANRTVEKAQLLYHYFQNKEVELSAISLSQLSLYQTTLLIHATSNREFSSTLPATLLQKVEMAYDLNYGHGQSFF